MLTDYYLGLGKTIFNSSVALIPDDSLEKTEILVTERFNRIKNSGAWPETALLKLLPRIQGKSLQIRENRDVYSTLEFEKYYNSRFPFEERLSLTGLGPFSTLKNPLQSLNHHLAHAWSALAFCPFEECLLLVVDGAGSPKDDSDESHEYLSLFRWKNRNLELLEKKFLTFKSSKIPGQSFCEGIGIFYEKCSEYIFNSKLEAGKVMGLAPLGESSGVQSSYTAYLESLDWNKKFSGKGKKNWEESSYLKDYKNLAATVQENFEAFLYKYLLEVKHKYPQEKNFILTGGCALNCTFNGKLVRKKIFEKIYIPFNPGDEGISLGCAFAPYFEHHKTTWSPLSWNKLSSSRGSYESIALDQDIEETFKKFNLQRYDNPVTELARILANGTIVAFLQGRSEVGPRALGNRSILASIKRKDLKKYLNEHIKFREDFRPYGCTVQWEKSHLYFDVSPGFENPFMSFAVPVREEFAEALKDVSHVDGTSRMQTLHREQHEMYYDLLGEVEKLTGFPILLNTSLNVMNEPIVETVSDAKRFFETSQVEVMCIGNYIIRK